jgi:hypothetical protein
LHAKFHVNPDVTVGSKVWAMPLVWGSASLLKKEPDF